MVPARRNSTPRAWMPSLFNAFFDDDWTRDWGEMMPRFDRNSTPAMNIMEKEKEYDLEIAAPGMTKEDFKVSLNENGDLVINMEKTNSTEDKNEGKTHGHYLRKEFSHTKFQQTLILPDDARRDDITAKVENGILSVVIPKIEKEKEENPSRDIEIC